MKIKSEPLVMKTEPEEDGVPWGVGPALNGDINNTDDGTSKIKLEPTSHSEDGTSSVEDEHKEGFQCAKREYVMIKLERPPTPDHESNEATPSTDNTSCIVKSEYDDHEESNNVENEKQNDNPKFHTVYVKAEVEDKVSEKTDRNDSLICENLTEKDKHFFNIKCILENTNATLIRSQEDAGYTCYFCDKYYQNPADLKDHATNTHTIVDEKDFTKIYVAGYVAKLDITGLYCKLCNSNIESLENSIAHLNEAHKMKLFLDIKNQILPFKFNSTVHKCCICSKDFNKFRSLQSHVQTHYRNYECGECDLAFINRMKLLQHFQAHKVGTFTCQFCSKEFNTEFKKRKHEKNVHDQSLKVKCGLCNERFKYPRQKELHLTKVHSVDPTNKCHLCEKVFVTQDGLSVHVKRDHLKTRNARCTECEMSFFSPSQLRVHMVKHTGIPQFECEVCHKSYRRKNYYYEHMRMHTNERRHKCKHCEMAFVHKTSLRHHLQAKHGEKYTPG